MENSYQDLPEDPTGRLRDFEDFVKSNFDIFQWIGLLIILAQVRNLELPGFVKGKPYMVLIPPK